MPGGMGFRFSEDRRQPLLTMYGLLDHAVVARDGKITFVFKNGMEL